MTRQTSSGRRLSPTFANERIDPGRAVRVRLDLDTYLIMPLGERIKVTVIDISKDGVRLQVPEPIFVGEVVELELGRSGYAKVNICWSEGSEAGGTFVGMC